jgi:hypothetical protein
LLLIICHDLNQVVVLLHIFLKRQIRLLWFLTYEFHQTMLLLADIDALNNLAIA